jgi:hypothetical protein
MFLTDCHSCGLRELRGARSVELLANTDHGAGGPVLVYRCTRCDASNVLSASRASAGAPAPVATPVAA